MLLKGENIPSSEGFPGQEDSSVEERQVSADPHAPHLFPLESFLVQPQGNVLAVDPQVHGKHALDLGTQPVDRIEEAMGSRVLRVHYHLFASGKAAAEVPPCRDRRRSRALYGLGTHPWNPLCQPVPSFRAGEAHGLGSLCRSRPGGGVWTVPAFSCLSVLTSAR